MFFKTKKTRKNNRYPRLGPLQLEATIFGRFLMLEVVPVIIDYWDICIANQYTQSVAIKFLMVNKQKLSESFASSSLIKFLKKEVITMCYEVT